ncbi:MAG: DUF2510 domain-containing protein [Candidatus Nanopelagicales bacterium]|nr:DUF2510 domain-containing protein [Candidatus Nanopelagicales bacterium]
MTPGSSPVPGWYQDPFDANQVRWWDGSGWTDHVQEFSTTPSSPVADTPVAPEFAAPTPTAAAAAVPFEPAPYEVPQWSPAGSPAAAAPAELAAPVRQQPAEVNPFVAGPIDAAAATGSVLPGHGTPNVPDAGGAPAGAGAPQGGEWQAGAQASTQFGMPQTQASFGAPPISQPTYGAPPISQPTYGFGSPAEGGATYGPGGAPAGMGSMGQPAAAVSPTETGPAAVSGPEGTEKSRKKSRKGLMVLLIILGVIIVAAAVVWFFVLRKGDAPAVPKNASAVSASPTAPAAASAGVAPPCAATVTALTADGTSSTVISRLEAAATNQNLPDTAAFFSAVSQQAASVMTASGQACLDAAKAGQAPAAYADFIEQFNKAVSDGAALAQLGASTPTGVSAENAAVLTTAARDLTAAQHAVAPAAPPAVAPAG